MINQNDKKRRDRTDERAKIWDHVGDAHNHRNQHGIWHIHEGHTDKTEDELFEIQLDGAEEIISWYTNDNALPLGVAGVL